MEIASTPMPTRSAHPERAPVYAHAAPDPARGVGALLLACVCYLAFLSFINARGAGVSSLTVGAAEALLYGLCLALQWRRLPLATVTMAMCIAAWLVFCWLIRQGIDPKGVRDLMIPLLFISLGRQVADVGFADSTLKRLTLLIVFLGVFEALFTQLFGQIFNTFAFYVNVGGIRESGAMFEGQTLTLNSYRPEGIGRTLLPQLLGPHRASSLLMEPVSLGNFALVLLAWGLSKPWADIFRAPFFIVCAVILITLADSRLGMVLGLAMVAFRLLPAGLGRALAPTLPFVILGMVLAMTLLLPSTGDNPLGRLTTSGLALLRFDGWMLMGLSGPLPIFGDMGYAYIISRFGVPLCLLLITALFTLPMGDERGQRFRALVVLYIFTNFAVSGTSVFALKTAAVLWFLMGVLSAAAPAPAAGAPAR